MGEKPLTKSALKNSTPTSLFIYSGLQAKSVACKKTRFGKLSTLQLKSYTWQVVVGRTSSYRGKHDRLGKADCPVFLASYSLPGYTSPLARVGVLNYVNMPKRLEFACLSRPPTGSTQLGHGNITISYIVLAALCWIHLTPSEGTKLFLCIRRSTPFCPAGKHPFAGRRMSLDCISLPG